MGIVVLLTCAVSLVLTAGSVHAGGLRPRPPIVDGLLALEGAGAAAGGLLLLDDVGVASWVVAPLVAAILVPVHVRSLFAGEGPFRT